jgi:MFS family permease
MSFKRPDVSGALLAIIGEGFFSRLSFGVISFALPLYALHLGLSLTEIGLLLSLNAVAEQALKPVAGHAADRFGLKPVFTLAISLRSLVAFLLVFAAAPWQLFAIRALHGISESLRDPSVNALIAESGNHRRLASSFAWYATAKSVAGSLGKAATGVVLALTAYDYSQVFFSAFILSALPLYVVARYVKEPSRAEDPESNGAGQDDTRERSGQNEPAAQSRPPVSVRAFAILGFLIAGTANMLHNLFPVVAIEYAGLTAAETGLIYTLAIPVVIVSGPAFGWVSDHVSRKLVLMVRGIANVFSSIIYLAFPTFVGLASGKVIDDMGKAAFRPAWGALMTYVSGFDRSRRARTMGYLGFGEGVGEIIGPVLAGLLWNMWGLVAVVIARVVLALASELYAIGLVRSLEKTGWRYGRNSDKFERSERGAGDNLQGAGLS